MRRPLSPLAGGLILIFGMVLGGGSNGDEPSPTLPEANDCGTIALYQFLQIESRPTTWNGIVAQLGQPPRAGHSLRELRDVACHFGLELAGTRLEMAKQQPLDRLAIFFVKRGIAGHFFIVRPVGTTGKLVQILDGVEPPEVMDCTELTNLPGWTGLALMPRRMSWSRLSILLLLGGVSLELLRRIVPWFWRARGLRPNQGMPVAWGDRA